MRYKMLNFALIVEGLPQPAHRFAKDSAIRLLNAKNRLF